MYILAVTTTLNGSRTFANKSAYVGTVRMAAGSDTTHKTVNGCRCSLLTRPQMRSICQRVYRKTWSRTAKRQPSFSINCQYPVSVELNIERDGRFCVIWKFMSVLVELPTPKLTNLSTSNTVDRTFMSTWHVPLLRECTPVEGLTSAP
jgi:hypothetical protein